jgi:hypothetical protein
VNALAWGLQIFLAIAFLLHGLLYTVAFGAMNRRMQERGQSRPSLPPAFRQFIGVAEIAAAFGLTVPPAIHVLPWLAPLAAAGLVIVMAGAVVHHARRREPQMVAVVAVLGVLAAATLILRWLVVPL